MFRMISNSGCPLVAFILCYGYIIILKIKRAFRNESKKKLLAIVIEAWDLVASKPISGIRFCGLLCVKSINLMKLLKILGL